jgi:hypothetical protein
MKLAIAALLFFLLFGSQAFAENRLGRALTKAAPELNPNVLSLALQAMKCAEANGVSPSDRLAVIDYSLPSTERRLWIFDILKPRLLFRELVAHGKTTGENFAQYFSNEPGSLATSLGLFKTLETYQGANGYSCVCRDWSRVLMIELMIARLLSMAPPMWTLKWLARKGG